MKRLLVLGTVVSLFLAAMTFSGEVGRKLTGALQVDVEKRNPWTNLNVNDAPDTFHFAIVSDRTGGHRARVFSEAVDRINLLQPAFVVSVGDLIEGYTRDQQKLEEEWKEFQTYAHALQMPFFYCGGNHDLANAIQTKMWKERFGRLYYDFTYRNVLFLMLCSDDPNQEEGKEKFSPEQIDWIKKTLERNKDVSWTMVFMHKPLWSYGDVDKSGILEVEKLLKDRPYTVFAGHVHRYRKYVRQDRNYYMLATTGGISRMRGMEYGEFDHIVWVTMKKDGPVVSNILLEGIYPEDLKPTVRPEEGYVRAGLERVTPVSGTVRFNGGPAAGALVTYYKIVDEKTKKATRIADALADADGSYKLSTYTAFDGAPAGNYFVTVTSNDPRYITSGDPGPNRLPARYASPSTSTLMVTVKGGERNVIDIELSK